jgi:hypothetical protein
MLFIFSLIANAKDCEFAQVDTKNMPDNQTQNDLEWCFAFSAANTLSFYEKEKLSPYHIALLHHLNPVIAKQISNKNLGEVFGSPGKAMLIAAILSPSGICQESEAKQEENFWRKRSDFFNKLAQETSSIQALRCDPNAPPVLKELSENILQALEKLSGGKKAAAFLDVTCEKHKMSNQYSSKSFKYADLKNNSSDFLLSEVNRILDKSEPLSIGYSIGVILPDHKYQNKDYIHASTVVGRKWNENLKLCEYLIRDSYNKKDCSAANSKIRCVGHDFWVDESTLKANLMSVESVDVTQLK